MTYVKRLTFQWTFSLRAASERNPRWISPLPRPEETQAVVACTVASLRLSRADWAMQMLQVIVASDYSHIRLQQEAFLRKAFSAERHRRPRHLSSLAPPTQGRYLPRPPIRQSDDGAGTLKCCITWRRRKSGGLHQSERVPGRNYKAKKK